MSGGEQQMLALARALAVRAFLIDQGVDTLRINVQAEGGKDSGTPADRVDLFLPQPAAAPMPPRASLDGIGKLRST